MTVKEIVQQLRSEGHRVTTYQRMDVQGRKRGLVIRSIDNIHYTGSKGNEIGRVMVGAKLSEYQQEAMNRLNKVSKKTGKKFSNRPVSQRRLQKIDREITDRLKDIQKEYRKRGREYGLPTLTKYRYHLKTHGKDVADKMLAQAERYAKGLVYKENVDAFIERLTQVAEKLEVDASPIIRKIKRYPLDNFTEAKLDLLIQAYYNLIINNPNVFNNPEEAIEEFSRKAREILAS